MRFRRRKLALGMVLLAIALSCTHLEASASQESNRLYCEAVRAMGKGDLKQSMAIISKALKTYPNDPLLISHKGLLYNSLGDHKSCKRELDRVLKLNKGEVKGDQLIRTYIVLGYSDMCCGDKTSAFRNVDQAIKISPECAEAFHIRALIKEKYATDKEALVDFDKASTFAPANRLCVERTIYCAQRVGAKDIERKWLTVLSAPKASFTDLKLHANIMQSHHNDKAVLEDGNRMIRMNPHVSDGYKLVIPILIKQDKFLEALDTSLYGLDQVPNDIDLGNFAYQCKAHFGTGNSAISAYKDLLRDNPKAAGAHEQIASLLLGQDRFEDAVSEFDKAAKIREPISNAILHDRAVAHRMSQDLNGAIRDYGTLFKRSPNPVYVIPQITCEVGAGKYNQALNTISTVRKSKLTSPLTKTQQADLFLNEASCYLQLEKYALARDKATESLNLTPHRVQANIVRVRANLKLKDDEKALSDLNIIINKQPEFTVAYAERAKIYERQGKLELARKDKENVQKYSKLLENDLIGGSR